MKEKVLIGMSGGVDSSVAALLLKEEGYEVIGATMQLLDDDKTKDAIKDAKKICELIKMEHIVIDLRKEFKEQIIDDFIKSYKEGKTPNPCVNCNRKFKFGLFLEEAKKRGINYIATGHYAKVENNHLVMSDVESKDQSYFLCQIKKEVLPHILFPLNKYKTKEEVRNIASNYNLEVSKKKDSQEICFIPNDDYKSFLKNKIKTKSGNITLKDGTVLGKHNGIYNYTIGQRKGLNIAYKEPLYVLEINVDKNEVIVGSNDELYHKTLTATNMNYLIEKEEFFKEKEIYAKIRSRAKLEKVLNIKEENNNLVVTFENKERAITPGQLIAFYDKNKVCIGGGYIEK
jgi:tRNA-specific 2-thiouridylase